FVPMFDYGTYASYRTRLKIDTANLLSLDTKYSVPDFASSLRDLWNAGQLKVIQNVGYANSDLSHFVSTDIWDSAQTGTGEKSGWLGRYLWLQHSDFLTNPPPDPLAIQIGGDGNILFFNEDNINMAMNVVDPDALYQIAQTGALYSVTGNAPCYYQDQLDFMKSMINSTYYQSQSIHDAYTSGSNTVTFPDGLGKALALVSRLIKGGLSTKIYMLTIDGFDTHAQQDTRHPLLLTELADSVKAFYADLAAGSKDTDVLTMTFSEFGRRVNDNASLGTDHGTCAPLLMFGPALGGNGFIGDDVNLMDLDNNGNLKYKIDFRQVYSTVLQDWLCTDELLTDTLLGGQFGKLMLGFGCASVGMPQYPTVRKLHQLRYDNGTPYLHLSLSESANVMLEVYDVLGKRIVSGRNDYYSSGTHKINFPGITRWTPGSYFYKLYINGKLESGKVQKY
ncbi:MAG TPA: DUF1501 domain-containing protein, partial [Chitinophagales bacterium]|nr:DUF1501 domain-containing protein [Chitinophagales bacterium]